MARACWGIDLGQCALKAIKLSYDSKKDRVVAEGFEYIEHPKILSQPDAEPEEMIQAALEKFLSRNDVAGHAVVISVPGQSGLARFVKLPPVESKKIPDIVKFEAKQQIPFSLDEVTWDYQKIGGGAEEEGFALETEVGIFAIRKDIVFRNLAPFQSAGIEVEVVQLSPVSLYNFAAFDVFLHAHSLAENKKAEEDAEADEQASGDDAAAEGEEAEEEEGDAIVILDIGADKTDVVITDGDSIWLRNLPIGGNHFTRALSKELKLTFAKAEHLKRNATKAPDPKKLYKAMRGVFQDYVGDLQRSIAYYTSTHRDRTIRKIVGAGNGFKLPGLQNFLEQNLQYKVQRINRFNGMVGDDVLEVATFSENIPGFCVAYGLALQGLEQTPIQTNLLPQEIRAARMIRDKKPFMLAAAAMVLLAFVINYVGNFRIFRAVHAETFEGPVKQANQAVQQFTGWDGEFGGAVNNLKTLSESGQELIGADSMEQAADWIEIFKLINDALPPRSRGTKVADVQTVEEVNIEFIEVSHMDDLSGWLGEFQENQLNTMDPNERNAPPSGEGWVVRLLGYTHHKDEMNFVTSKVLKRLQNDALRKQGVTHAVLQWGEPDREWNPGKASRLEQQRRRLSQNTGTDTSGTAPVPTSEPTETPAVDLTRVPAEFRDYLEKSTAKAKERAAQRMTRYDFVIEFAWAPPPPEPEPTEEDLGIIDGTQPEGGAP